MQKILSLLLVCSFCMVSLVGCGVNEPANRENYETPEIKDNTNITDVDNVEVVYEGIQIELSDEQITLDGVEITNDSTQAVYVANDIVYYEDGHDFTYGEGTEKDAHSKEEADAHTVVHITQPGQYVLSGKLSKGQIAVDLGEDAEDDSNAVVTLVLNNIDITCDVAPAIIFYNVYESCEADEETATKDVDTSLSGANVIIADNTVNTVNGSYVARIYKPDSVVLSEDGTEVVDEKKLHKYDAAFYSKMSMNIDGGDLDNGILNINAENEGLDSELHLTINGGIVNIESGNDGINTNEDYISVTTINDGTVNILVNGSTGEGDGIDSNGWLVINGGTVISQACSFSADAGIDSDMGIHINGGTVFATGNMLDRISESEQTFAVFNFSNNNLKGTYYLKDSNSEIIAESTPTNDFTYLIISSENLVAGDYTLWCDDTQLQGVGSSNMGGRGGMRPEMNGQIPKDFENMTPPKQLNGEVKIPMEKPDGERPNDFNPETMKPKFEKNEDGTITLEDGTIIDPSEFENKGMGGRGPGGHEDINMPNDAIELSDIFTIVNGENYFIIFIVDKKEKIY